MKRLRLSELFADFLRQRPLEDLRRGQWLPDDKLAEALADEATLSYGALTCDQRLRCIDFLISFGAVPRFRALLEARLEGATITPSDLAFLDEFYGEPLELDISRLQALLDCFGIRRHSLLDQTAARQLAKRVERTYHSAWPDETEVKVGTVGPAGWHRAETDTLLLDFGLYLLKPVVLRCTPTRWPSYRELKHVLQTSRIYKLQILGPDASWLLDYEDGYDGYMHLRFASPMALASIENSEWT